VKHKRITKVGHKTNMTEAYDFAPGQDQQTTADIPFAEDKPELQVIAGSSEEMRRMFMLLADGASTVVDYRNCESNGGRPRYHFPSYPLGRTVLKSVHNSIAE
jgi:hypothetical protein